jgi:hypothetical protein
MLPGHAKGVRKGAGSPQEMPELQTAFSSEPKESISPEVLFGDGMSKGK